MSHGRSPETGRMRRIAAGFTVDVSGSHSRTGRAGGGHRRRAAFGRGLPRRQHAQAFPSFGSERTGAPVVSFCRIDDKEIRLREPILEPDALIVQDPTLLKAIDVFQGLRPEGYLLVNTNKPLADLDIAAVLAKLPAGHARAVPATEFALRHVGRPLPNAALLGAFAALSGLVHLHSVAAATAAYDAIVSTAAAA